MQNPHEVPTTEFEPPVGIWDHHKAYTLGWVLHGMSEFHDAVTDRDETIHEASEYLTDQNNRYGTYASRLAVYSPGQVTNIRAAIQEQMVEPDQVEQEVLELLDSDPTTERRNLFIRKLQQQIKLNTVQIEIDTQTAREKQTDLLNKKTDELLRIPEMIYDSDPVLADIMPANAIISYAMAIESIEDKIAKLTSSSERATRALKSATEWSEHAVEFGASHVEVLSDGILASLRGVFGKQHDNVTQVEQEVEELLKNRKSIYTPDQFAKRIVDIVQSANDVLVMEYEYYQEAIEWLLDNKS